MGNKSSKRKKVQRQDKDVVDVGAKSNGANRNQYKSSKPQPKSRQIANINTNRSQYKSSKSQPKPKVIDAVNNPRPPANIQPPMYIPFQQKKKVEYAASVYKRQNQLFNVLKHIDIELDGNIITDDIWRIVADYATGKLIRCKRCKIQFCVISEDQIYLNIDYNQHKHKRNVYFQTSAPPFMEVIYCKPCYEKKYIYQTDEKYNRFHQRDANRYDANRNITYGGPGY